MGRRPKTKASGSKPNLPRAMTMVGYVLRPTTCSDDLPSCAHSSERVLMKVPMPLTLRREKTACGYQ